MSYHMLPAKTFERLNLIYGQLRGSTVEDMQIRDILSARKASHHEGMAIAYFPHEAAGSEFWRAREAERWKVGREEEPGHVFSAVSRIVTAIGLGQDGHSEAVY